MAELSLFHVDTTICGPSLPPRRQSLGYSHQERSPLSSPHPQGAQLWEPEQGQCGPQAVPGALGSNGHYHDL